MSTTLKKVNKEQSSIKKQMKGLNNKIDKMEQNQNQTNTDIKKKIKDNHTEVVNNIKQLVQELKIWKAKWMQIRMK